MPDDPEQVISRELETGERLLWAGSPRHGIVIRGSDAFLIPFSLMWGGFAVFWEISVLHTKAPGFFALWGAMYSSMRWQGSGQYLPPAFELIPDAKRIYNLIRQTQESK